jgi:hypothetical protein
VPEQKRVCIMYCYGMDNYYGLSLWLECVACVHKDQSGGGR